jgi:hypothetical protein
MKQSKMKSGNSTEIAEFKFELKVFDDCEQVEKHSIFSKYLTLNTPESFESNKSITCTSALLPVYS